MAASESGYTEYKGQEEDTVKYQLAINEKLLLKVLHLALQVE